ncbi:MAG: ATP-dependent Clp protease adaptor ClpS [Phycisphaerae bacterium]|nr:ATP-dependent Clp protease adaptor ClpS [Phycisphaerae bacterium]
MSEPETPRPEIPAAQPSTGKDEPRTAVAERPAPSSSKPASKNLPPFRVMLHNDDINDMLYVTATLMELTPLGKERSLMVMMEAHQSGVALVLVTHKERAELYQEQFQSKSLVVSIEPAEA